MDAKESIKDFCEKQIKGSMINLGTSPDNMVLFTNVGKIAAFRAVVEYISHLPETVDTKVIINKYVDDCADKMSASGTMKTYAQHAHAWDILTDLLDELERGERNAL